MQRPYEAVWGWLAGHLSELGAPLPGGGHAVELRIRPGGKEVSRPIRLRVGGLIAGEQRARAALGWADAARPRLFPRLEAVLEIAPVPHDIVPFTQLGVIARYRPPFGRLGAIGDRLVGAEVTDAALTTFLDELTDAVASHTSPPLLPPAAEQRQIHASADQAEAGIRRVFLTVEGLGVRRGGAVGACQVLSDTSGVVNVSLDPRSGLVAVDHDPARCGLDQLTAALEEEPLTTPDRPDEPGMT